MRRIVYSGQVSIDGFYEDADGDFSWAAPDEELHRFYNQEQRDAGASLLGRRMYETMDPYWTRAASEPAGPAHIDEFALAWVDTPRYVVSRTLTSVADGVTLLSGDLAEDVRRLQELPGGPISVGGPGLANSLASLGLVDEVQLVVHPTVVGSGKAFLGPAFAGSDWELVEQRQVSPGVPLLRYARRP